MKITVGGSMTFAKEQIGAKEKLEKMGHEVLVTDDIEFFLEDGKKGKLSFEDELKFCLKADIIRSFFDKIANSDAYLICNYEKNGIKGYLGASVLMEIGLAYYLKKKIFLLSEIDREQKYALEIAVMDPVVIYDDLNKIS